MRIPGTSPIFDLSDNDIDEHFKEAVEVVTQYDRASASLVQRRLGIGYARSARIIDQLEAAGVVGPAEGANPREVLIKSPQELFGDNWERLATKGKQEEAMWTPEPSKNYKVPRNIKLTTAANSPWGKQFSDVWQSSYLKDLKIEFPIPLGFDDQGNLKIESLLDVNNLIIAGNPLSQKEKLVDTILLTYLLRYDPTQLKIILIDTTHYLDLYDGIIHLLSPVIYSNDKIYSAMRWALAESDRRLEQFGKVGVRDLKAFNDKSGIGGVPHILIITFLDTFDELTEDALIRLTAQGARTGIHNIIITDHSSSVFLPKMLKSNIPARAVFRLTLAGESRAIETSGAEKLEPGALIYKPNYGESAKLKAIFTPEVNVKEVVSAVKQ